MVRFGGFLLVDHVRESFDSAYSFIDHAIGFFGSLNVLSNFALVNDDPHHHQATYALSAAIFSSAHCMSASVISAGRARAVKRGKASPNSARCHGSL